MQLNRRDINDKINRRYVSNFDNNKKRHQSNDEKDFDKSKMHSKKYRNNLNKIKTDTMSNLLDDVINNI